MRIEQLLQKNLSEFIKIRHQLHQVPELKYEEHQTSRLIQKSLEKMGCQVQTGVGKTGLVALLETNRPGETIALRADMDALPIQEETNVPYASGHAGVMHACGHDGHSATLLLVASVLMQLKDQLNGRVKFLFQPAEEGGKGALAMIEHGVLKHPKVNRIFGYHNWPGLALGTVLTRSGAILAGNGRFEITIKGKIAHTAMPDNAINPVTIGAELIAKLDQLRKTLPQGLILNITHFQGGLPTGAMADTAKIIALYYMESLNAFCDLKQQIQKLGEIIAAKTGANIQIVFHEFHAPMINTEIETDLIRQVVKQAPAMTSIEAGKALMAAEDFSEYLMRVPGSFFMIGAGEDIPPVHTAKYDFPDEIMPVAAEVFCRIVLNLLAIRP